jgi:eukaryotic-like serine/threonine-protein kinase
MAELYRCPRCGNVLSDTLGGHCPGCLLKEGLAESSAGPPGRDTEAYQSRPAKTAIPRTDELPSPGQDFGAYHIVRALGRGGMGSVFEAEELDSGRRHRVRFFRGVEFGQVLHGGHSIASLRTTLP